MIDTRKMSADALIVIGVLLGLTALAWAAPAHRIDGFAVGAGFALLGLLGRARIPGVFHVALAGAIWLFLAPWVLSGGTPGLVVVDLVLSAVAFGFAGSAIAEYASTRADA